jgi:murein L,D-transpeptidase YcbB/YkuD
MAVPQLALAAPADQGLGVAEWRQSYDSGSRVKNVQSSAPILSQATLQATERAEAQYRDIVARGGWQSLPKVSLKLGSKNNAVTALRRRLIVSGDLAQNLGDSQIFDSYVEAAVKRAQARHGLGATGIVGPQTLAALNVPAATRLKQLEINVVRLRSLQGNLGRRYVTANIPAAYAETVEDGVVATRHTTVVGKIDRQSPIMTAKATDINFNPYWTVPASIIRKDLIPKMQADPGYLKEQKIHVFDSKGQEVQPQFINWNSMEATNYRFRQEPGALNSLGTVRINIANPYGVYMHDTPSKGLFGDDYRFDSSGCMRVQNVREYITWLLKDTPGWGRPQIDEAIRSGERIDARLAQAVPVYWVYVTAWATPEGAVQFREDIYNKDGMGPGALTQVLQQEAAADPDRH